MTNALGDYMTIKQAAAIIGIEASTLNARIRKGKIKAEKVGWNKFIHKNEVKRAKSVEDKKHANNKNMETSTR
jgi:excisionase family DNA binding protein